MINGSRSYPGANFLELENGTLIDLSIFHDDKRKALASKLLSKTYKYSGNNVKKVHRHLENGDLVLVNRQPTLHKPGVMAHTARILKDQKTIRLHYANCSTYNADFDGDEMNIHAPQDHYGRSEAMNIMNADKQYLVPTDGESLSLSLS